MSDLWPFLLQTLTASGAAALLLAVKAIFRDKLSPRWQFAMWGVLGLVLLLPAGLGGRHVLFNWPMLVETLRSALTGEFGVLTRVVAPVPLPRFRLPLSWADWLYVVYLAGAAILLARYIASYVLLRLALRRGTPAGKAQRSRIAAVAERYGLRSCRAVEVPGLTSAFVCGVFRPVLALPAGREADDKVLLHELLHLKHRDVAWGVLICLLRCLHWCNPLLWYCADRAGNDLESRCDQRVLERLAGEDRRDYGRILLDMADEKYARAPGTSSMANGGKNIRRRIQAIARFKLYPAGMALASVCVALVLGAPLLIGTPASAVWEGGNAFPRSLRQAAAMASARTTPCTTYAGAFDTYAKAVLTGNLTYRAMCAPLEEQDAVAALWGEEGRWTLEQMGLPVEIHAQVGYEIYNLTQVEENAWEGLLAVTLLKMPPGEDWDGGVATQWMAVQPLRAEREGERWVIRPQGELRCVQGDRRMANNQGLPSWEYRAVAGDFTVRVRRQTTSSVNSYGQANWFGYSTFVPTPQPGGTFTTTYYQDLWVLYTGDRLDRERYHCATITVACAALWKGQDRPELPQIDPGSNTVHISLSDGQDRGWQTLEDWRDEIFLSGTWSDTDTRYGIPDAYAAEFSLNGGPAVELTLLPVEGGGWDD